MMMEGFDAGSGRCTSIFEQENVQSQSPYGTTFLKSIDAKSTHVMIAFVAAGCCCQLHAYS